MVTDPRIAILTPYSYSDYAGGIEVFNAQLAACFPGAEIFALPRRGMRGLRWSLDSVGLEHPLRAWRVARSFVDAHRRRPFELAICNGLYGWPLAAFPPDIPSIQVYHYTLVGLARKGIAERGVRAHMEHVEGAFDRVAARAKSIVAVARGVLEEVRRFYHQDGTVIPNGVDLGLFTPRDRLACRSELGLSPDARVGIFVGRAEHAKGFDLVREIAGRSPDIDFLLVGECPDLPGRVTVRRHVPHDQMPKLYSAADFLLLPSRYEGFNLTVLEALACGLPILVSRAAYALEEDPRGLGVVVGSADPEAYLAALDQLPSITDGRAERQRVAARYGVARFQEAWRGLVQRLLGGVS